MKVLEIKFANIYLFKDFCEGHIVEQKCIMRYKVENGPNVFYYILINPMDNQFERLVFDLDSDNFHVKLIDAYPRQTLPNGLLIKFVRFTQNHLNYIVSFDKHYFQATYSKYIYACACRVLIRVISTNRLKITSA